MDNSYFEVVAGAELDDDDEEGDDEDDDEDGDDEGDEDPPSDPDDFCSDDLCPEDDEPVLSALEDSAPGVEDFAPSRLSVR